MNACVIVPAVPWPAGGVNAWVSEECVPIAWCVNDASEWSAWVRVAAAPDPVMDGRDPPAVEATLPDGAEWSAPDGAVLDGTDTPAVDATDPDATASVGRDAAAVEATDPDTTARLGREALAADACEWLGKDALATEA